VTIIEVAESVDATLHAAVTTLLPQVSSSAPPTLDELTAIVANPGTALLLARQDDRIVGMLTLATFAAPSGVRAWVEDVVVDDSVRRGGVASALVTAALEHAARLGARTVDLTSRPQREAANKLYLKLGFEQRLTNVYRYSLEGDPSP
jgi:ribosomal protein S18 acetylase RimI-like enzyme